MTEFKKKCHCAACDNELYSKVATSRGNEGKVFVALCPKCLKKMYRKGYKDAFKKGQEKAS